jgi:hypothetical protein
MKYSYELRAVEIVFCSMLIKEQRVQGLMYE